MQILTILFSLSLLSSAVVADRYCYYDSYDDFVCQERLNIGIRIAIAIICLLVFTALVSTFALRRRRLARANLVLLQNQPQGAAPSQGGFPGMPFGGSGQKPEPGPGPQQYTPQQTGQVNQQYTGQYNPQYAAPFDPYSARPEHNAQPEPQFNAQHGPQEPQYTGQAEPQYQTPQYPPAAYDNNQPSQPAPPYTMTSGPTNLAAKN